MKVLCNDENFVGCSGVRDDSDLYLTKSLSSKAETNVNPSKSLLANGFDRKSDENIGGSCENESFDKNGATNCDGEVGNIFEKNSVIKQNGLLEDHGTMDSSENIVADQNGITGDDGNLGSSENSDNGTSTEKGNGTPTDSGTPIEKSSDLSDSMTSSSNTVVEDTNCSKTKEIKVTRSQIENVHQGLETGLGLSPTRCVSKAINCRSNHRLNDFNDDTLLFQNGSAPTHVENHIANSFSESRDTPKSPKEMSFNKVKNFLDIDGLSLVLDPVQARLVKLERYYREKIQGLETKLHAQGFACGVAPKVNIKHDMVRSYLEFIQRAV